MKTATVYSLSATKEGAEKACANGAFQPTEEESRKVLAGLREKFETGFEGYRVFALKISVEALWSMGLDPSTSPKFQQTSCSNCGCVFGPGDHGFSHCRDHAGMKRAQS